MIVLLIYLSNFQVISLGDTIKFSLSPTKTRDRLSANVSGVPLDERNLVCLSIICCLQVDIVGCLR